MPYPWTWLDKEHDELRSDLRDAEPFFSTEAIPAVKILTRATVEDFVATIAEGPTQGRNHWWTARCRVMKYRATRTGPPYPKHQKAPDIDCTCGFYALKSLDEMSRGEKQWASASRYAHKLTGLWYVELAGLVIEHERGYRAEKLRLVSKWEGRDPVEVLREMGQGTTGEIREACGFWSGNDSVYVRTALKAAARNGECIEVKTPVPNNHGGHLWIALESVEVSS